MQVIRDWLNRHLNDPQVVALTLVLLVVFGIVIVFGDMLAPVFASLIIAYLLEGIVKYLERLGLRRLPAVIIVFLLFLAFLALVVLALIPTLSQQVVQLVENLPNMIDRGQSAFLALPDKYPELFSRDQVLALLATIKTEALGTGRAIVASFSLQSVVKVFTLVLYMILVPLLVFFFLKDKRPLLAWVGRYLPRHRRLADTVWHDVDAQIGNYVRGKFLEIVIVWLVSFATFLALGLEFSMLLAVLVGLSVIVPYVGATVVTAPIAVVAYFQFGPTADFLSVLIAYAIIQALDGNVLVPVLFSEVVSLHPVAIIVAILVFGGIWGFWGVFFAIPLATVIKAIIDAWPRSSSCQPSEPA